MEVPAACTIAANNYISHARVFSRSFLKHNPHGQVFVLIVDRPCPAIDYAREPFEVLFVKDLGLPNFLNLAFKYSILELSTAVKPAFLKRLLKTSGHSTLCYFDPDILVLKDLSSLYGLTRHYNLVLTPHITAPTNGCPPTEREFLRAGIYNLGFLGIRSNDQTLSFLDWWQARLQNDCVVRSSEELFVDQRWMDLAPALVPDTCVLREPGYNVAYWNLCERPIVRERDNLTVEGHPLQFFHFSGYDPDQLEQISRHDPGLSLADRPSLAWLFGEYRRKLEEEGYEWARRLPYSYLHFDNQVPITPAVRQALRLVDPRADRWPNPFDTRSEDSFFSWLLRPIPGRPGVRLPTLALLLWQQRKELQEAFPSPTKSDQSEFAAWLVDGAGRHDLPDVFRQAIQESAETARLSGSGGRGQPELDPWRLDADGYLRRPRITRAAMRIHEERSDVASMFPDPLGASRDAFALWYATHGAREYRLPFSLVYPTLSTLSFSEKVKAAFWYVRELFRRNRGTAAT